MPNRHMRWRMVSIMYRLIQTLCLSSVRVDRGAGPINGPIQAAAILAGFRSCFDFNWRIFGVHQDFASMYASVKIRTYNRIHHRRVHWKIRKEIISFRWLFCILVVAAFADVL